MGRDVLPHLLFDLGDVLIAVDHQRHVQGIAALAGCSTDLVAQALFGSGLKRRLDLGQVTVTDFWNECCQRLGTKIPFIDLARAHGDIFTPITPTIQLLEQARREGHRCCLLTNTDPLHLATIQRRWPAIARFGEVIASCTVGSRKPEARFFVEALRILGLTDQARHCLLIDDRQDNCQAARSLGLQAVQATSPAAVRRGLLAAGVGIGPGGPDAEALLDVDGARSGG